MTATQLAVEVQYRKHSDGRIYIDSYDVPGLHLAGTDLDALHEDLDPVVKELLFRNMGIEVESLHWVPTPEEVKRQLSRPDPEGTAIYVASMKAA
jgi:hypothetical protein